MEKPEILESINEHERVIFAQLLRAILERKSPDIPFIVGINGIDGSGKTSIASKFAEFLRDQAHI